MFTLPLLLVFSLPAELPCLYAEPVRPRTVERSVILADLKSQVPPHEGNRLSSFGDAITDAHESTHGIHHRLSPRGKQALYLLQKRYVVLPIPKMKLADVQAFVPEKLRGHRFDTYVVKQSTTRWETINGQMTLVASWNDNPLYLMNEATSYNNGAEVGLELAGLGVYGKVRNDLLLAPLEMAVYVTAMATAIKKHDPVFWKEQTFFRRVLTHEIQRGVDLYVKGQKIDWFRWENSTLRDLRRKECKPLMDTFKELGVSVPKP